MEARSLRVLEYDKIVARLMDRTSFAPGRELAAALQPATHESEVRARLAETTAAVQMIERYGPFPLGGLRDIRGTLAAARVGSTLAPSLLLDTADTLVAAERMKRFLHEHIGPESPQSSPHPLRHLADLISVHPHLVKEIQRCISDEGAVLDSASPELTRIRQQIRTLRQRVRERLDSYIRSAQTQKLLQEPIVTVRAGRYVLPVRQEYRSALPGIVHDQSASGATLFIEPMPVVELNNQLRTYEVEEEKEVERILAALTALVAAEAPVITNTLSSLARLDFIAAKAQLSMEWKAVEPALNQHGLVRIIAGRHPLLGKHAVPIDIHLGDGFRVLVITGPNTGGKTVTLKTVGLFILLAQSGLHVPAQAGTELPILRGVYADIGDEQSIEQSLSTFSSHMTNIVRILSRLGPRDLVLFDELGAGTDPAEGAALAMAILEHLRSVGCLAVATTHYSELKSFAYQEAGFENASVEFDPETLQPTYKLSIGIPGRSNAFAIAERLGLSPKIVNRARERLSSDELRADVLIQKLEVARRDAEADRAQAEKLRQEAETLRARYEKLEAELREQRSARLEAAQQEAERLLTQARSETDELVGRLRKLLRTLEIKADSLPTEGDHGDDPDQLDAEEQVAQQVQTVREAISSRLDLLQSRQRSESDGHPEEKANRTDSTAESSLHIGAWVQVNTIGQQGEILRLNETEALVQVGSLRLHVPRSRLKVVSRKPASLGASQIAASTSAQDERGAQRLARMKGEQIASELDLRGLTVEEALAQVDKYLDDVSLSGLDRVRLIHGKGTGALRQAVQAYLRSHPRVHTFRLGAPGEGGDGVTIAALQ